MINLPPTMMEQIQLDADWLILKYLVRHYEEHKNIGGLIGDCMLGNQCPQYIRFIND